MKKYPLVDPYNNIVGHIELDDAMAASIIDRKPQLNLGYSLVGNDKEGEELSRFTLTTVKF